MMDCKKALQEVGGDIAKAEKLLKEKGLDVDTEKIGITETVEEILKATKN